MKTQEELNTLKEEVATVSRKLAELTEDELEQVTAGIKPSSTCCWFGGVIDAEGRPGQVKVKIIRESKDRLPGGDTVIRGRK